MAYFLSFYQLQLVRTLSLQIPEAWEKYPFRAEPPSEGHYREYPLPEGGGGEENTQ